MHALPFDESVISPSGNKDAWDASSSELVARMLDRWRLTAGTAFGGGEAGAVLRVTDIDGGTAVLKVGYPHFEATWEAVGLEAFGPDCAPTVLRQDVSAWALLLEEISPGETLVATGLPAIEMLDIALTLYDRTRTVAAPQGMLRLDNVLARYREGADATIAAESANLREMKILDLVVEAYSDAHSLIATSPSGGLLHGDLNPGNIIRGRRSRGDDPHGKYGTAVDRWFLIDPKPMIGDTAFDLAPLLNEIGRPVLRPHSPDVLWRFTRVAAERLGIEAGRIARWSRYRSALDVAWYLEDDAVPEVRRSVAALRSWDRVVAYSEGTRSA